MGHSFGKVENHRLRGSKLTTQTLHEKIMCSLKFMSGYLCSNSYEIAVKLVDYELRFVKTAHTNTYLNKKKKYVTRKIVVFARPLLPLTYLLDF